MDDEEPLPLSYARPGVSRPPPPPPDDDRDVRVGGTLQLLLSIPCVMTQFQACFAPSSSATAASLPARLAVMGLTLAYPTLAAVAYLGSQDRYRGQRRRLYRVYMAGTAALLAVVAVAVLRSRSGGPPESRWSYVGLVLVLLLANPAAVWIAGRWVIGLPFPPARPPPRGFPPDDPPATIDDGPDRGG